MTSRNLILVSISLVFLSGCTSAPEYTWVKAGTSDKQYAIADASCKSEAYKAIPDGGSINCRPTGRQVFCKNSSSKKTRMLREQIYDGCMLDKGWEKQPKQ